jgi:hypothetical protein
MDPLRPIQPNQFGFDPSLSLFPGANPGLDGAALTRAAGLQNASFGSDPMMQMLMQNHLIMQQTVMQLMQMVMQLMGNQNGLANPAGTGINGVNAGGASSGASAGGSAPPAANSSIGAGGNAASGPIQASDTGTKLAEIAKAEATNGDSSGGWCYRDVSRALSKIGITVTGGSAYMAAEQLAKNPKVQEVKVSQDQLKSLPAGAIVVWDKGAGHEHGHISIATGDGKEASDLMRNQITNYGTSFRVFMPK